MATRSTIAVLHNDGKVSSIYCHWDGYLNWNGKILSNHYNTLEQAESLVALGNLSSLGARLVPYVDEEHTFDKRVKNVCLFYGRDRGEDDQEACIYDSLEDYFLQNNWEEYDYIFKDGKWNVVTDVCKRKIEALTITE